MADQVQVKLVGDDKAFLKTLQQLRDRFKQLQSASNKAQKTVRAGADKSKTQLNLQRNAVRLLSGAYARLGRVAVASQKLMQTQIRRTSSLLRKQIALLKRAGVAPRGGAIGAAGARQPRQVRTPANDRPQFFGVPAAQTRPAPTGTPIRNVNAQGNLTQAALAKEQAAIQRVDAQRERSAQRAIAGEQRKAASTQKSTGAIRKQSQPLTLLVAKFALMAFAVQTLANILNSTFGAALRNIDEFQVAAIGTAAAVTSIADVSEDAIGEAFDQNLRAALDTFEALELVAARFFATGQELQLAFNTLAQRGVVIREEEFETLGKITDQIKLLTGGQNTQIQIQQELRAILDGNIRTTTAFGKALQARGVDIGQLSREVRATGSLKPFEPFLTGLDAAGPAIRRTLSSVTATFSSLASILNRRIFQDTFDSVVSQITTINNFIIDNLDLLVAMGKAIRDDVAGGFSTALDLINRAGGALIKIATSDVGRVVAGIALINKALRLGPLGLIFGLAAGLAVLAKDGETFGRVISIAFSLVELAIQNSIPLLEKMIGLVDRVIRGTALLSSSLGGNEDSQQLLKLTIQARSAAGKIEALVDNLKDLRAEREQELADPNGGITEVRVGQIDEDIAESEGILTRMLATHKDLIEQIEANPVNATFKFTEEDEGEQKPLSERLKDSIKDIDDALKKATGNAGERIGTFSDKMKELFNTLAEEVTVTTTGGDAEFTPTEERINADSRVLEAERKQRRAEQDNLVKAQQAIRQREESEELARIKLRAEQRIISGREAFDAENVVREQSLQADIVAEKARAELISNRLIEDIAVVRSNAAAAEGPTKIQDQIDARVKETNLITTAEKSIAALRISSEDKAAQIGRLRLKITQDIAKVEKEVSAEIRSRQIESDKFGGQTNAERIQEINFSSAQQQLAFNERNTDPQQQDAFARQLEIERINKSIKTQIDAVTSAIDAAFATIVDGFVEGSFEFRELSKTLAKDFIIAGFEGIINEIKSTVTDGLTAIFKAAGDGSKDAAAGAQRAAQGLTLAFGLLLAVLSRTGNKGEFQASGAGAGGGVDQSSVQTRGLLGGDQNIAIAEINNGLQEALIPTNSILSAIEVNTRGLQGLSLGIDPNELAQAITAQVQGLFSQALLQTP